MSQVVQPLTKPVTFSLLRLMVQKSHGEDAGGARLSTSRVTQEGLNRFNVNVEGKPPEFFSVQLPGGADRE